MNDLSQATRYVAITACGFLRCQPRLRGTEHASAWDPYETRLANIGSRGDIRAGYLCLVICSAILTLIAPHVSPAQPSTAPPSSLPATPLSPSDNASGQLPSCDLCRQPESRAGSDVRPHRLPRDKALHPHKKPKGMHRPSRHSLRSLLPHYAPEKLGTQERTLESWQAQAIDGDTIRYGSERIRIRGLNAPELTEPGGREALERLSQILREGTIRIVPHGKDVYDRTVADVFMNGQNVVEILGLERSTRP